jgi:hypothetical protein
MEEWNITHDSFCFLNTSKAMVHENDSARIWASVCGVIFTLITVTVWVLTFLLFFDVLASTPAAWGSSLGCALIFTLFWSFCLFCWWPPVYFVPGNLMVVSSRVELILCSDCKTSGRRSVCGDSILLSNRSNLHASRLEQLTCKVQEDFFKDSNCSTTNCNQCMLFNENFTYSIIELIVLYSSSSLFV